MPDRSTQRIPALIAMMMALVWLGCSQGNSPSAPVDSVSLEFKKGDHIPDDLSRYTDLKLLYLNNTSISEVPEAVKDLKNLEMLWLNKNRIKSLPPWFASLEKLRFLNLSENPIKEIPESLLSMSSLKTLACNKMGINEIPAGLFELESLEDLQLQGNKLRYIPSGIIRSKRLKELNISDNPLDSFPSFVLGLDSIQVILASGCGIKELPAIDSHADLNMLDIRDNRISEWPESFYDLRCRILYISGNDFDIDLEKMTYADEIIELSISESQVPETTGFLNQYTSLRNLILYSKRDGSNSYEGLEKALQQRGIGFILRKWE